MADPTHITVTAPDGRRTPIHSDDGVEPGGGQLYITAGSVRRVRYSQAIRRAINRGDLVPCDANGAQCAIALAAAPDDLGLTTAAPPRRPYAPEPVPELAPEPLPPPEEALDVEPELDDHHDTEAP